MKRIIYFPLIVAALCLVAANFPAVAQNPAPLTTPPVYVPDYTHQNEPLPEGILAWDEIQKKVEATNGQDFARFVFAFTNVAAKIELSQATNVTCVTNFVTVTNTGFWARLRQKTHTEIGSINCSTNVVSVTNSVTPIPVTILDVHPSCGCTTAELPSRPWYLPPGTNGVIKLNVSLAGKSGLLIKTADVSTDKGRKQLVLQINIAPPPPVAPMSEEERARGIAAAKLDRQAVFKGDCASCHLPRIEGQYGQQLFAAVCAICHESSHRNAMVADLHNLKEPTSEEFWRTWITSGKAGTLMPAFSTTQGGPLNDMQIASLSAYLNAIIPPKPVPPTSAPVPAK